jgi:S-adenosylmethionine hydrolase
MRAITLTTDFGQSEYVAQMKGVILGIAPEAIIVDVSHEVTPQNIIEGAFVLMSTAPHFQDAIHVAVIDPGVGSDRRPILIECDHGILVGPDNGLLIPAARRLGFKACYEITDESFMQPEVSATFPGRDIFAPVAAFLMSGTEPSQMGDPIAEEDLVGLAIEDYRVEDNGAEGIVVRVDRFGNIITNIPRAAIEARLTKGEEIDVIVGEKGIRARFVGTYSDDEQGHVVVLFSSSSYLEISVRGGSAKEHIGAWPGERVHLKY